jgi:hypothetical protein
LADSYIAIDEPAVVDKKLDTEQITVGANTVERERFIMAGVGATDIVKPVAQDAVDIGSPVPIGGLASSVTPTAMSADGDRVKAWFTLNGALNVADAGGTLSIDDGAGSITVDGTVAVTNAGLTTLAGAVQAEDAASADGHTGIPALAVRKATPANTSGLDGDYEMLQVSAGRLWASATIDAALPAGNNNIGDVDVVTVNGVAPAFNTGVRGATVQRVTIATDDIVPVAQSGTWTVQPGNTANTTAWKVDGSAVTQPVSMATNTPVGTVAHDGADSGNPIKVGARAADTLSNDTMVANADRTDLVSDLDGALIVRPQIPLGDLISEAVSNTDGASTAFTNFGAVASTRSYITAIHVFRTDAGTSPAYVDFRDGTAGSVLFRVALPPNGGAAIASPIPLFRTSANTALAYDVSSALTTVYISVSGFKSKV